MLEKKISCTPSAADSSSAAIIDANEISDESLLESSANGGGRQSRSPCVSSQVIINEQSKFHCGGSLHNEKSFHHSSSFSDSPNCTRIRLHDEDERDLQDDKLPCETSKRHDHAIQEHLQVLLQIEGDDEDTCKSRGKSTCSRDSGRNERKQSHVSIDIIHPTDGQSSSSSECSGSEASLGGKRSNKSKDSFHSSEEQVIMNEGNVLSECHYVDNDLPVIAGMNFVHTSSDVDSAFEDSHYSGSSDDKGGLRVEDPHGNKQASGGNKNKNKRKPNSKHANEKTKSKKGRKSRCEDIAEVVGGDGSVGAMGDEYGDGNDPPDRIHGTSHTAHCDKQKTFFTTENNVSGKSFNSTESKRGYSSVGVFHGPTSPADGFGETHTQDDFTGERISGNIRKVGVTAFGGNENHLEHRRRMTTTSPSPPKTNEQMMLMNHLHYPEPTVFDMDLSPANPQLISSSQTSSETMPVQGNPYEDCHLNYQSLLSNEDSLMKYSASSFALPLAECETNDSPAGLPEGQAECDKNRESRDLSGEFLTEEDLDANGHPTTILLPPPLEVRVLPEDLDQLRESLSGKISKGSSSLSQQSGENPTFSGHRPSVVISPVGTDAPEVDPGSCLEGGRGSVCGGDAGGGRQCGDDGENCEDYKVVYVVPDGGWGWMVLFGSILVNILIPGTVKSFGVLFVEFLEVFNASPAAAAWIPALSYWLYSSMGPFASALALRFSHRSVTIVGGLLASFGLMLSYFATSIPYLYVSYGIIGGLGAGLAYPIGVFMVGQYFDKRRGLANGLCTSGSALGSVLIPPLLRFLLMEYGYRGAILIMGGILLNVCVGAMFYDPISRHMKKVLVPREKNEDSIGDETVVGTNNVVSHDTTQISSEVRPRHMRQVTSPIARTTGQPSVREMAASMPIAIPLPHPKDLRERERRGSGSGRRATFQIGHETPQGESWSYKSNEVASPLAARLVKEDHNGGASSSPNHWSAIYSQPGIRVRGHNPYLSGNDSNPELETLIHSNSSGMMVTPGGTTLSLSAMGTSRGHSRLNLTAIPEDDDTASDSGSHKKSEWNIYSAVPPGRQSLLRLSMAGGTQLVGSHGVHNTSHHTVTSQTGLSRTLSVASNVSNSSFHYVSTIHHGSLLTQMQLDKNIPEFASTMTLKSVRHSCCPSLKTLKEFMRKLTCGFWPKPETDATDRASIILPETTTTGELTTIAVPPATAPIAVTPTVPLKTKPAEKFIDLSLLNDGMYLIMLLSNSTTAVGYTNFIVLLPSYALSLGFDKSEAAFLLSVVAAWDFVGRIGGAALSDLQFISRKWFYIVGLFFSGLALSFLPMARAYSSLVVACSLFGLASGTYIGVTAVILADQLGAEKLGSSYGISLFLNGLLQLIGPPVCGVLLQEIGRMEPILTGLGIILIFGSTLWIFAPFIERNRMLQQQKAVRDQTQEIFDLEHQCRNGLVDDRLPSSNSAPAISSSLIGTSTANPILEASCGTKNADSRPAVLNGIKSVTSLV